MLLLSDVKNQPSLVLVESPLDDVTTAVNIVVLATTAPAVAEPAVNTYTLFTGSTTTAKLPVSGSPDGGITPGLPEGDTIRFHNNKHYPVTMFDGDGTTQIAFIPAGMEKSFEVSGGSWSVI